jgi:hypothetical protein
MKYFLRFWTCGHCRQLNKTAVSPEGTATCAHCTPVTRIHFPSWNAGRDVPPERLAR